MTLQPIFDYKILFKSLLNRKSPDNRVLIKSGRLAFNYIISAIKGINRKKPTAHITVPLTNAIGLRLNILTFTN